MSNKIKTSVKKQAMEGKTKPMTFEELKKVASELHADNQKMSAYIMKMQKALNDRAFDEMSFFLSMLFKVIEHAEKYSEDFVKWCIENIEKTLTSFHAAIAAREEAERAVEGDDTAGDAKEYNDTDEGAK